MADIINFPEKYSPGYIAAVEDALYLHTDAFQCKPKLTDRMTERQVMVAQRIVRDFRLQDPQRYNEEVLPRRMYGGRA